MFKFERFGGFSNKKNHIVQFKTRDKTLSPSILGVTSPVRKVDLLSTTSYPSSNNVDLFEFPPHLNSLLKPTTPTLERNQPVLDNRKEQDKKVPLIENKKVSPTPTPQPSTSLQPTTNKVEKEEEEEEDIDDGIFDFPDIEESKEIKLMVASSRSIIDKKAQRKPRSKNNKKKTPSLKSSTSSDTSTKKANTKTSKKKSNSSLPDPLVKQPKGVSTQTPRQSMPKQQQALQQQQQQRQLQQQQLQQQAEEDSIFDIFQFDFNPTVHIRHSSANNEINNYAPPPTYTFDSQQTPTNYNTTTSNIPQPVYNNHTNQNIMPFQPQYNHRQQNPMMSIDSVLLDDPMAFQQVNDFLNETQPLSNISNTQQPKKRKRNLVAQLKSASGETAKSKKGFDFLSDEEESLQLNSEASDIVPFREFIQKERSTSPELTYNERMELELEAMMRSEFKESESNILIDKAIQMDEEKQRRPRYQPQNKLNVKVTFEKKK